MSLTLVALALLALAGIVCWLAGLQVTIKQPPNPIANGGCSELPQQLIARPLEGLVDEGV
jgi:hypothetical protein